jgi:hypothetical protein
MNRQGLVAAACFVVLILVLTIGARLPWKLMEQGTRVQEQAFRLTLPGKWFSNPRPDATGWSYRSEDSREALTVSLVAWKQRLGRDEESKALKRVMEIRRQVESKAINMPSLTMTEPAIAESDGIFAARYGGAAESKQYRFHTLLLSSPLAITVFFYEANGLTKEESDTRGRAIFNSIVVPK